MPDAFEQLRDPGVPVAPRPSFSAQLRARLERAFDLPKGVTVSDLDLDLDRGLEDRAGESDPGAGAGLGAGSASPLVPYIAVEGAADAIDWYVRALGAEPIGEPIITPDGRVGHAELRIAGGRLMLADEFPSIGVAAPSPDAGVHVTLYLEVENVDATIERAMAAGARLDRAAADYAYGRNAVLRDPFGHRWLVSQPPPAPPATARGGGVA